MMEPKTSSSTLVLKLTLLLLLLNLSLCADKYGRHDFPSDFVFGSATTAYQVEGGANEDGRTPSIWDTYAHDGHAHGDNGDVACDGYHKYKEDVQLMVETGIDSYRFSISWSRLIPNGRGPVNPKGLRYYNNLLDELIPNGIEPHVTLHNFDLPQALEDEYGGWVSRNIMIMEPLVRGDYPISMKKNAGARIPAFTNRESEQVKGSCDFIGLIHYYNINVTDNSDALNTNLRDYGADMAALLLFDIFSYEELPVTPWYLLEELDKFKLLYGNPPIYIYENGQRTASNSTLQDVSRVECLHGYIGATLDALRYGSNVKGYFVGSLMDVFELLVGYESSFGLYYVDRNDPELKRYPKLSAEWYSQFLKARRIELEKDPSSLVSVGHFFQ